MDLHSTVRFSGESLNSTPQTLLTYIRVDADSIIAEGDWNRVYCMEVENEE